MVTHHIGLMSGTSLDGLDGVILRREGDRLSVIQAAHLDMPADLRARLLALNSPGPNELHLASLAANELVQGYARVVRQLLSDAGLPASAIRAIGAHGQTVRHQPLAAGGRADVHAPWSAYTLQLNNPALLAELTGITVVADFRSRDVAAGGQGAPLVPAFHRAVFAQDNRHVAVVNIGGMANVTLLSPDGSVRGFDTGPGNVLMDTWCERHTGQRYDAGGAWGAQGTVQSDVLQTMLRDPYFSLTGPKSTGRELFNADWIDQQVSVSQATLPTAPDVQATLCELTARSIAGALPTACQDVVVCGGGAFNTQLMSALQRALPHAVVVRSDTRGLPAMDVEAAAFAWLAEQTLLGLPGNLVEVTGAAGPRVLGAVYPA
jgi:anhydro-N-acetylmuramic acid kinase